MDRIALIELSRGECLALLHAQPALLGRVALVDAQGLPLVFPVNYRLLGERIVFRTGEGTVLAGARNTRVAFEADDVEPFYRKGWSVLARGVVTEVDDRALLQQVEAARLSPWAPGVRDHVLALMIGEISGRRIT